MKCDESLFLSFMKEYFPSFPQQLNRSCLTSCHAASLKSRDLMLQGELGVLVLPERVRAKEHVQPDSGSG